MLHENATVIYVQIALTMDPLNNAQYVHIMGEIPTPLPVCKWPSALTTSQTIEYS